MLKELLLVCAYLCPEGHRLVLSVELESVLFVSLFVPKESLLLRERTKVSVIINAIFFYVHTSMLSHTLLVLHIAAHAE